MRYSLQVSGPFAPFEALRGPSVQFHPDPCRASLQEGPKGRDSFARRERKSEMAQDFRLRPCFQRWVLLLESAVTALGLLERFLTRPQALCIPSFVDRAIVAATPQLASTESQLVTRANSHYNVWTVCVLYIRQLLLAAGNVSDERLEASCILSLLWRLLPVNRLRQIRIRLLHLQATF